MADFFMKISPSVIIGSHVLSRLGHIVLRWTGESERRFMLVSDPAMREFGIEEKALQALKESGIDALLFGDMAAADSTAISNALSLARGAKIRGVISLGGIKAAAVGRAVAALYSEEGSIYDYIEGLRPLSAPLPFVQFSSTCRDPAMFMNKTPVTDARNGQNTFIKIQDDVCKAVVMDPNVYMRIPANTQAAMLFQSAVLAFEGYISTRANFFSDTILKEALEIIFLALDPDQDKVLAAPPEMLAAQGGCMASLGVAISSPGIATALALACNARCRTPSSVVSAALFPFIVEDAFRSSAEKARTLARMLNVSLDSAAVQSGDAAAIAGEEIRKRLDAIGLPLRLKDAGLTIEQLAASVEDASKMDIMNYVPRSMSSDDLFDFAKQAY